MSLLLEPGFTGCLPDQSSDDYHASGAHGSTDIKAMRQSAAHYKAQIEGRKQHSKSTREAFDLGSASHEMILEKSADRFLKGPDVSSKAVKAWKEFVDANPDKICLTSSEHNRVLSMFTAFYQHPLAGKLLLGCQPETSFYAVDHNTGLWVKARPDGWCSEYILDYKTTSKPATPREFANTCAQLGYDVSAAHYSSVVEAVTRVRPKAFYWIVQEVFAPYQLMIYRASPNLLVGAQMKRDELMGKIERAIKANDYPGYPPDVVELDLPAWAIEQQVMESVG